MIRLASFSSHARILGAVACLGVMIPAGLQADELQPPPDASGWLAEQVESVRSCRVLVAFQTLPGRDPVTQADLWYTQDRGATWHEALTKNQPTSPLAHTVPTDGLYGYFLVLHNARASSPAPSPGTAAHTWVRVDCTLPVVQILALTPDPRFDLNREILIRWMAQDDNCGDRPVSLHYRSEQTPRYELIARDVASAGTHRWTVPEEAAGRLDIKVTAADRAGNRGIYVADWLQIVEGRVRSVRNDESKRAIEAAQSLDESSPVASSPDLGTGSLVDETASTIHSEPDAGEKTLRQGAAKAAKKQYDLGTWHRLRGERDVAVERYRDALRYYPGYVAARNDLAGLLLLRGDVTEARAEFQRLLETDPRHCPALKGLALVQAKQRDYRSAFETLQKVLLIEPDDAETWLNYGDVCMFLGDRPAARDAWTHAREMKDAPEAVANRALKRLEIYRSRPATGSEPGP